MSAGLKNFIYRKFWAPLLAQLKQGTSAEKITWSVAAGATISTFPVFGATTTLGILIAYLFKLNHVVLQAVNYLAMPAQVAAIPILVRMGETIFGLPHVSFNPARIGPDFMASPGLFLKVYGVSAAAGIAVWLVLAPFALFGIRALFLPILKQRLRGSKLRSAAALQDPEK